MQDLGKYIEGLELSYPRAAYRVVSKVTRGNAAAAITKEEVEQSFLADKSLVSFVAGVSARNKADILNSLLLAQMVANKKVSGSDQTLAWYQAFTEVMDNMGIWVLEATRTATFDSSSRLFEIQNAVIDILTAAFGNNYIAIIQKTLEAINKLADGDGRITAFDKNTHSGTNGCFQMGVAVEENGTVSLQMGTFLVTTSDTTKKILFIKTAKDDTKLEYISRKATFNAPVYSKIRDKVLIKIADKGGEFLDEVTL